ncbi:MAG TPA: glutamate racemase [Aggregatilineaceae bacterium]|nr:glutamate racemase [Aggregatilineaceae bacterium]
MPLPVPSPADRPIGVLDSGVGGLSVLREMRAQLPAEHVIYLADQEHVPYGPRSIEEVRAFTVEMARFLIERDAKLVVVACNTASAAALHHLRESFPDTPFVGMEPAVKPAARDTKSGVIGVIATEATFQGELYASVVGRFAQEVRVETRACPEFVRLAEAGETDTPAARAAVQRCLAPLLEAGIDQLVLGCTHFPFLKDAIQAEIGSGVTVVDPSPAVARQIGRVLAERALLADGTDPGRVIYYTSGDPVVFRKTLRALLGAEIADAADVRAARWTEGNARLTVTQVRAEKP